MSRTKSTINNLKYSVTGQTLTLVLSFFTRMAFVRSLNAEYLGLNGLFSNILSILSLSELGLGAAIVYSMYKPLAENDVIKLKGLMQLYKKTYFKVGVFILVAGTLLTPFLSYLIKESPNIPNIRLIYMMYVVNSGFTYFFSYKRTLLVADQKKYIESIYHYSSLMVCNILQITVLLLTKNFLLYLSIQMLTTMIENYIVSTKVDTLYPYLKDLKNGHLDQSERITIFKNVKAMIFHKLGNVIVMGTDNLLISKFVGLVEVGLYSNYLLITQALNQLFGIVFQSLIASIGNLGATETNNKNEFIFRCVDLLGLWIYGFSSIALITLFNPFITLWAGEQYLFPLDVVLLITLSFYLTGRRKSVLAFRDALGLFWYDRYKPIFESIINLLISAILAILMGIEGIILGTIVSTLTTSFWVEPYVLYKNGFKTSTAKYFYRYLKYSSLVVVIGIFNFWVSSYFDESQFEFFIGKLVTTAFIPNILFVAVFRNTVEFKYLLNILRSNIKKSNNI